MIWVWQSGKLQLDVDTAPSENRCQLLTTEVIHPSILWGPEDPRVYSNAPGTGLTSWGQFRVHDQAHVASDLGDRVWLTKAWLRGKEGDIPPAGSRLLPVFPRLLHEEGPWEWTAGL